MALRYVLASVDKLTSTDVQPGSLTLTWRNDGTAVFEWTAAETGRPVSLSMPHQAAKELRQVLGAFKPVPA